MDPMLNQQNPVLPELPQQQVPHRWFWILLIALLLFFVIVSLAFVAMPKKVHAPTVTPMQNGIPQATKTTDLAPSIPNSQKTVVTIENSDSSLEKVIMPTAQVAGYIKSLPEGTRVVSQAPAGQ